MHGTYPLSAPSYVLYMQNNLFKEDFEKERSDRARIQGMYEALEKELEEKKQTLVETKKKFHNFQHTAEHRQNEVLLIA